MAGTITVGELLSDPSSSNKITIGTGTTLDLVSGAGSVIHPPPVGMDDVSGVARATSGLLFNSDTATANALDDYEEGTWTPTQGTGLSVSGSFSSSGVYTKIGRLVCIEGVVTGSTSVSVPSINSITIRNMPFTPSYSRSQGIAGNHEITGGVVGFQAPNTDIYFSETMGATTNIRFAITFITS